MDKTRMGKSTGYAKAKTNIEAGIAVVRKASGVFRDKPKGGDLCPAEAGGGSSSSSGGEGPPAWGPTRKPGGRGIGPRAAGASAGRGSCGGIR